MTTQAPMTRDQLKERLRTRLIDGTMSREDVVAKINSFDAQYNPDGTIKASEQAVTEQVPQPTVSPQVQTAAEAVEVNVNPDFVEDNQPMERTFLQSVGDFFTGGQPGMKNVFSAPEMSVMPWQEGDWKAAFKASLGGLLTGDPEEIKRIIATNFPDAVFGDIQGQPAVRLESGDYLLNPKGVDPLDISRFGMDVAAFTPAGRVTGGTAGQLVKGAAAAGATQTGLQAAEAATGGSFDPTDIAVEAATGGAFQKAEAIASPFISRLSDRFKGLFKRGEADEYKTVAEGLKTQTGQNLLPQIMADPEVMKAADELGINVNPGVYSTSDIYREMENSLKAIPNSKLSAQEKETIRALGNKADELLLEWTGTVDKSQISADFSDRMLKQVQSMADEEEILYRSFEELAPKSMRLQGQKLNTVDLIKEEAESLGGFENLDGPLQQMYKALTVEGGPTQGLINKYRRQIGQAIGKGSGPFQDADMGALKQLYGALSEDSYKIPELLGLADEVKLARSLTQQRKQLEESLQGALGKDLSKSLMAELGLGVSQLAKGKTAKFNEVMNAVPEDERQMVALAALNDLFAGGTTKARDFSLGGFVSSYEALNRNKAAANELFQYIPDSAKERLDQMYLISKGLMEQNRKDLANPSGTARQIIGALDNPEGPLAKLYGVAKTTGVATAATAPFDAGILGFVSGLSSGLTRAAASGRTKATQAADELLTSNAFKDAMQRFIEGNPESANRILSGTSAGRKWLDLQPPEIKRAIARQGFIQWLTSTEDEQE